MPTGPNDKVDPKDKVEVDEFKKILDKSGIPSITIARTEDTLRADYEQNPQYYIDDELSKERMNKLIEAQMLKAQRAEEKQKAEELGDKTNDVFENLTGEDINRDGRIGDKEAPKEEENRPNGPEPKPEEPKPEVPKEEAPKPLPKVVDDLYDAVDKAYAQDKERYPEKYDTPEHSLERQKQVLSSTKAYLEKLDADYKNHPDYYTTADDINTRKENVKNAVEVEMGLHPQGSTIDRLAKNNPVGSLDSPRKTLTDAVNEGKKPEDCVSFEQLLKADAVRMHDGTPFPQGLKTWEQDQMLMEMVKNDQPVYVETGKGIQRLTVDPSDSTKTKAQPCETDKMRNERLINFEVKKAAMTELTKVQNTMNAMSEQTKKTPEFKEFQKKLNESAKTLKETPFKGEFNRVFKECNVEAEKFLQSTVAKKDTELLRQEKDLALQVRNINKDVQKGKVAEKTEPTLQDSLRFDIACKSIKSYANSFKKSDDEVKRGLADDINSSSEAFMREVDKAMKDPGFVALFGDSKHPVDDKFLQKCSTSKGSDIIKAVNQKNKELDAKNLSEVKEANKHASRDTRQPVSAENKEAFKENVINIRHELMKNYKEGKDPAMDKLMFDLEVAEVRFKTGSKWMNYNKLSAQLADDAEAVHKQMLEKGESVKTHWFSANDSPVYAETGKLMQMDDCIKDNKSIKDNPYNSQEAAKKDLATKIVLDTKKLLEKDKDKNMTEITNLENKQIFDKKVDEIMKSDAFKEMTNNKSQKDLEKMLAQSSHNTAIEYGKVQNQLERKGLSKAETKQLEESKKLSEEAKKREEKSAQKDAIKKESGPSAVYR